MIGYKLRKDASKLRLLRIGSTYEKHMKQRNESNLRGGDICQTQKQSKNKSIGNYG